MSVTRSPDEVRELLKRVRDATSRWDGGKTRVLEAIAWPREVEERFFADGASKLPEVTYRVDREALERRIRDLRELEARVGGDEPVARWLRSSLGSMVDANRLVLAAGTSAFHDLSRELYGGARTRFPGGKERNVDLAEHLLARLRIHGWDEARDPEPVYLTDEEMAAFLRTRAAETFPDLPLDVVVDETCAAKVLAGMSRVRIRRGATFAPWEARGLWHHEVETHVLTARNGALQPAVPFLRSGGPRVTRTQEGLAVFSELYNHSLSTERMERLALRVKLVDMAEQGADFLDLYRLLVGRGAPPRDAYLDAQRICRGGKVTGGAPFTKDASYLSGLLRVQSFLAAVVRGGFRDEMELLACGRIDLEDVVALVLLRQMGILARPRYLPGWLRDWRTLLPHFAFLSFTDDVDLGPVADHYRDLIELASSATPAA